MKTRPLVTMYSSSIRPHLTMDSNGENETVFSVEGDPAIIPFGALSKISI